MRDLFAELRRRHVYKTAVLYAVAAWVLVQIADLVLEDFDPSHQVMQVVILLAALGFPVAVVLAWRYDLGPDGISVTPVESEPAAPSEEPRPGIVVLPFNSDSDEPEDELLCSGFTRDLTTLLAGASGFPVVSSDGAIASGDQSRDTGPDSGVRYRLQGSLRRLGEQLRVTVQLVQTDDGSQLWADHYDTSSEDLHQVQDALLRDIALQLGVEPAPDFPVE